MKENKNNKKRSLIRHSIVYIVHQTVNNDLLSKYRPYIMFLKESYIFFLFPFRYSHLNRTQSFDGFFICVLMLYLLSLTFINNSSDVQSLKINYNKSLRLCRLYTIGEFNIKIKPFSHQSNVLVCSPFFSLFCFTIQYTFFMCLQHKTHKY